MRLFVGVRLDEAVVAAAEEAAERIRKRLGTGLKVRWMAAANMHLTVRFIGNVEDVREGMVLEALRPALSLAPFEIRLGRCGVFPPGGPPRVMWIGLAFGVPSLRAMHQEFNRRLEPLGYEPERREFSAHLTLARIGDAPGRAGRSLRESVEAVVPSPARCTVESATVFQSRLSPKGATYLPLFDVPCMG